MGVMINELVGANANADTNDWVTTLALLDFVRRAKNVPAKNLTTSGHGHFGPGGHNLKESERGPPKEHSCEI